MKVKNKFMVYFKVWVERQGAVELLDNEEILYLPSDHPDYMNLVVLEKLKLKLFFRGKLVNYELSKSIKYK